MRHIPVVSLRLVREKTVPYETHSLADSKHAHELFRTLVEDLDRETLWVVCLDTKNRINCLSQVAVGTLNASLAHPRELLKVAILANAAGFILVHNHPSGDPAPSAEDRLLTQRMREAGNILGISLMDHIIIGHDRYYSFADARDL